MGQMSFRFIFQSVLFGLTAVHMLVFFLIPYTYQFRDTVLGVFALVVAAGFVLLLRTRYTLPKEEEYATAAYSTAVFGWTLLGLAFLFGFLEIPA